ncbi:DNA repair protein RecO [Sphingomonas baiyangensis]|uniref:DNA repair protein RecO n=1 Tax=Sphingomonas baiyangensis TaxID=2572576 RepID=A0A4U1L9Z0_9SPHN|nr:DNA repair protein RecO [Sphingomonas baiyangensis]TKD53156.1 DNA repair protein RecO [Sphingomonas baiyangensis]
MHLSAPAIILSMRQHGEHGAIVRALTPDDGVQPGYVRGGRSRALRPVLQPGNLVQGNWRARTDAQLPALTIELTHSRAPLFAEPLPAAAIAWLTTLTVSTLPEAQPYPRLHAGLAAALDAIEAAPVARRWATLVARYELLLLAELGFGLALDACVATGVTDDLAWVSPRSGGAVSRAAAYGHEPRLLPLPAFLRDGGEAPDWPALFAALAITRHFLDRDLLRDRAADLLAARDRLGGLLARAAA